MKNGSVIVLGTGDMMTKKPSYEGQAPAFKGVVDIFADERAQLSVPEGLSASALQPTEEVRYSTGRLEQALMRDCHVYVVSLKHGPAEHDAWWMSMLPAQCVFFCDELGNFDATVPVGARTLFPYQRLYETLNLRWNADWTRVKQVRADLRDNGVLFADDLPKVQGIS